MNIRIHSSIIILLVGFFTPSIIFRMFALLWGLNISEPVIFLVLVFTVLSSFIAIIATLVMAEDNNHKTYQFKIPLPNIQVKKG